MDNTLFSPSSICTIAATFSAVISAIFIFFLWRAYQTKADSPIPFFWIPVVSALVFVVNLGELIYVKSSILDVNPNISQPVLTEDQTRDFLSGIGVMNTTRIMYVVEKKLSEIDKTHQDINVEDDLYLLEQTVLQIIYSGRECADNMGFRLPNGEKLSEVMMRIYPEEEIIAELRYLANELFKDNITTREKLKAVEAHIETKQFELLQEVINIGFNQTVSR